MMRRQVIAWLVWCTLLAVVTVVMRWARQDVDQSHAALTMLLIVVGGSAAAGRPLGFTLAAAGSCLIDYFFQPPFDLISINKPLDVVVLVAFLATAFVVTELLTRAREEATAAESRAREVESLARAGGESLRYADPREALASIAELSRASLGVAECVIVGLSHADDRPTSITSTAAGPHDVFLPAARQALARNALVWQGADGVLTESPMDSDASPAPITATVFVLPLRAEHRLVGALGIRADRLLHLDDARRRLLGAFGFYAALGLERARLVAAEALGERLREAHRAREEVFASVSHDLRTPLTTIKALAQAGVARGDDAAMSIAEQADRLAKMVGDLLDVSRLRTGTVALHPELNTAEDLIGAALRRTEGIRDGRELRASLDLQAPTLVGRFDFVHTLRALGNLLDNAIRHAPPAGVVEIGCERQDAWLVFTVADRGPGIATNERERIFDAFYRPAQSAPDAGHPGLGLAIARSLARIQGGDVSFTPRDGGGSIFALRLPSAELDLLEGGFDAPAEESFVDSADEADPVTRNS